MAQDTAESLRAKGINPRTGEPYVRGGAYNKDRSHSAAGSIAKFEKSEALKKEVTQKEKELRDQIGSLAAENSRLQRELAAAKENIELVREAAMLEASLKASEQMLQRELSRGTCGARARARDEGRHLPANRFSKGIPSTDETS